MADPDPIPTPTPTDTDRLATLRADLAAERVAHNAEKGKISKLETELAAAKAEVEAKVTTEVGKVTGKLTKMQERVVVAELKAKATELQLLDPDLILHPLLDRTKITIDDEGVVSGVEEAFTALKAKKPEWFKKELTAEEKAKLEKDAKDAADAAALLARRTGGAAPGNAGGAPAETNVAKMTPVEYAAHKANLRRNLRVAS